MDDTLRIELVLPANDVFGFEHAPKNKNEEETIFLSMSQLENINNIITTEPACAIDLIKVDNDTISNQQHHSAEEHEDHSAEEHGDTHSNVTAMYELSCGTDIVLTFRLFEQFTSLQSITVQYVSSQQQKLFTATQDKPTILLPR